MKRTVTTQLIRIFALVVVLGTPFSPSAGVQEAPPKGRPERLGVQANIVFLYYKDTAAAAHFYEDILGLRLSVDQTAEFVGPDGKTRRGFTKIYQISPTSFVGLVDETQGHHRASEAKAVTLSFVTEQVDEWYDYLVSKGVKMRGPVRDSASYPIRGFVAYDPEGYFLEFERFLDHPQNAKLLKSLKGK